MSDPEKPRLKPASENPWYVLMTVAGEQTATHFVSFDLDLHAQNRRYWNGWVAEALSEDEKQALIETKRATGDDLTPLTDNERVAITRALADRCPAGKHPEPGTCPDFRHSVVGPISSVAFLFPDGVNFAGATFEGATSFQGATFLNPVDFSRTTLARDTDFTGVSFLESVDFRHAVFRGDADFQGAHCSNNAFFEEAHFLEFAIFEGASFSESAYFVQATFSRITSFENAVFSEGANFQSATFADDIGLCGAVFCRNASFRGANFSGEALFSGAKFNGAVSFAPHPEQHEPARPVRFKRAPPEFFNSALHEDTNFTDVAWPKVPDTREEAIRHRRAYERLKLLMDAQKRVYDEHFFHRKEMECREVEAKTWLTRWSIRAFRVLSDFGWSLTRPIVGLGTTLALGWALIFIAEWGDYNLGDWPAGTKPEYLGFWQSGALSLSNVFGFLGFNRTFLAEEVKTLTAFSEIVSGTQTVAGLILFFLLGLALRNRFRLK